MGRIPSGKVPQHSLQIIRGKHREIMRRLIVGEKQKYIALALGMRPERISIIVNSPIFKKEYEKLEKEVQSRFADKQADVQAEIDEYKPKALKVLKSIIDNDKVSGLQVSLPLKKETALDMLALGGLSKNNNGNNGNKGDSTGLGAAVDIISQGFALAKKAVEESQRRNEIEIDARKRTKKVGDGTSFSTQSPEAFDVEAVEVKEGDSIEEDKDKEENKDNNSSNDKSAFDTIAAAL